jgi:uncharacterized protein (DUF433 family)
MKSNERSNVMQTTFAQANSLQPPPIQLTSEIYGGEVYEYYPLGKYIVAAPGVCGGRPTFKYTRLEVSMILAQLSIGRTVDELVGDYRRPELTREAVYEALLLASKGVAKVFSVTQLANS